MKLQNVKVQRAISQYSNFSTNPTPHLRLFLILFQVAFQRQVFRALQGRVVVENAGGDFAGGLEDASVFGEVGEA